tara:strand:- start:1151 stop:1378 length:228 start_codon:yes stop_codon:yes gene_type:complete
MTREEIEEAKNLLKDIRSRWGTGFDLLGRELQAAVIRSEIMKIMAMQVYNEQPITEYVDRGRNAFAVQWPEDYNR